MRSTMSDAVVHWIQVGDDPPPGRTPGVGVCGSPVAMCAGVASATEEGSRERRVPRVDLAEFLAKTGFSVPRLASYLRVTPVYLEAVLAGQARLTIRDQTACRLLWRRLFRGKQMDLPFAEPIETFTRRHAQTLARARGTAADGPASSPSRASRTRTPRRAAKRDAAAISPTDRTDE
jgi:hypothetical protein